MMIEEYMETLMKTQTDNIIFDVKSSLILPSFALPA